MFLLFVFRLDSMNDGLNRSMNAGITIMAYRRHEPIAKSVR